MEKQTAVVNRLVTSQMLNTRSEEIASTAHDPVDGVILLQEQIGQIRSILSGDSGDQRDSLLIHQISDRVDADLHERENRATAGQLQ
jgi:hypothetical protein